MERHDRIERRWTGWWGRCQVSASALILVAVFSSGIGMAQVPPPAPTPGGPEPSSGVAVQPNARIEGRVVDEAGRPVAESSVYATFERSAINQGCLSTDLQETDAEGRFVFEGLPAGTTSLRVDAAEHYQLEPVSVELAAGETVGGLELSVEAGASVSGRVLGPSREPVPDAWISAKGLLEKTWSDANGWYRLSGLPPGPVTLFANARDHIGARETLDLDSGEEALDFVLETGVTVSGRVVRADGEPVEGCEVVLMPTSEDELDWARTGERMETRADGSFDLVAVGDGTFTMVAGVSAEFLDPGNAWSYELPEPVTVAGAPIEDLEVRLPPTATIRGRILGLGPEALEKLSVGVRQAEFYFPFSEATVDSDGTFESVELLPGRWTVAAYLPDGRSASETVEIVEGMTEVIVDLAPDEPQ